MKKIIGREAYIILLNDIFKSKEAELLAIYGRRRIGKTFLIRNYFQTKGIYLEITGIKDGNMHDQL